MELERKTFHAELKAVDEPTGVIEAIVSVFNNTDLGGDIVRAGAFNQSLGRKMPKGVWMHDWEQPVAKTLMAKELEPGNPMLPPALANLGGLYVKGQFNLDTQRGREAFSDIKFGLVDEFSIGYYASKVMYNDKTFERELIECELIEWSPVLQGMNPATLLISAKSAEGAHRDGLRFAEQLDMALAAIKAAQAQATAAQTEVTAAVARAKEIVSLRQAEQKVGKVLSAANLAKLQDASTQLSDHSTGIMSVIEMIDELCDLVLGEPEDEEPQEDDAGQPAKSAAEVQALKLRIAQRMSALYQAA
jgi:HK97 family phage prohead protease